MMNPFKQRTRPVAVVPGTAGNRTAAETAETGSSNTPSDPAALVGRAGALISEGVVNVVVAFQTALEAAELGCQRIESMEVACRRDLPDGIARLETRLEAIQAGLDALRGEVVRVSSRLTQCVSHLETLEQNLGQVRLMIEGLVRRTEELNAEFIERQVSDPLYAEFTRLHGLLRGLAGNGTENWRDEVNAVADAVAQFLDCAGLNLIDPQPGDPFDPRLHQPLRDRPTADAAQQGKVVRTLRLGVRRNGRLIQPARVEVFAFRADSAEQNPTKKEAKIP
jgi:molecular chaperone GrpE